MVNPCVTAALGAPLHVDTLGNPPNDVTGAFSAPEFFIGPGIHGAGADLTNTSAGLKTRRRFNLIAVKCSQTLQF